MKRIIPTTFKVFSLTLLAGSVANAAPITGPGGQIISATTATTLINSAGGCTGPGAAGCLIDGIFNSSAGTFVEWVNLSPPQVETFTFTFNQPYDVTRFLLWNDRGFADSGIANFDLVFKDPGGIPIGLPYSNTALANRGNNPAPEVFGVGLYANVKSVDLRVINTYDPPPNGVTQVREVEFDGIPVPEPASMALIGLGGLPLLWRGRKNG